CGPWARNRRRRTRRKRTSRRAIARKKPRAVASVSTAFSSDTANAYLTVNNVEVIYDHVILVLKGVSLHVPEGKIVALLGANGAGKSTTLKAISGLLRTERRDVTKGTIEFQALPIHRKDPAEVVKRGMVQAMEARH